MAAVDSQVGAASAGAESERVGSMWQIRHHDEEPYLGFFCEGKRIRGQIRYGSPSDRKHLLSIGPPGTGKSTGLVVPNVAHLRRSMIITDPKGEVAGICGSQRARMGRVLMLNPFGLLTDK